MEDKLGDEGDLGSDGAQFCRVRRWWAELDGGNRVHRMSQTRQEVNQIQVPHKE